ncbi:GNAT family N-acetyltransferase [Haloferax sp. DFSO60]|uniref:GNAT family N-acetyltransferase n=1 Tax=Haloferax sp. DFSO60 TaxID=3388652 RepID=UPI00397E298F
MFPDEILTPRLRLRPVSPETVEPLEMYEYTGSSRSETIEEEAEYLNWIPHETPTETLEFFESSANRRTEATGTSYAIFPREGEDGAGELAGNAALFPEWDKRRISFGMWLRKQYWGRGYSGERAAALFALSFDVLDFEVVNVHSLIDNDNSCRAIEKYVTRFGGQEDGTFRNDFVHDGEPVDSRSWSVTNEQWFDATDGEYTAEFSWEDRPPK